ncbi:hypothetical protein JB92DRAFT_3114698 [Gautieria morchelliformis]|nr:hypothetical protein JB92DRAFT_3114698 [Gautieria morchelliformis]
MGKRKKTGHITSSHVNYTAHRGLLGTRTVTTNLTQIRKERLAHEQEQQEKLNVLTAEAHQKIADAHLEIGINWEDADGEENNATISRAYDGDSDVSDELIQADGRHVGEQFMPHKGKHLKAIIVLVVLPTDKVASHIFQVTIVDLKEYDILHDIPQDPNELANVTLLHAGLLGSSPNDPSVAITLDCLEFYHQVRRRQPGFSVQAMCKVTYSPTFRVQLSDTFDVYLDLLRRVRELTNKKLGQDGPNWRLLNACPPCSYKLEDEPALVPVRLQAMDGNMSLKRIDGSGHTDEHIFHSDYHIPPSEVDRFKDDVHHPPSKAVNSWTSNKMTLDAGREASPFRKDDTVFTGNWAAANTISEDRVKVFEQTGGFVCACRHGLVQSFVEMRKSGELAKYGLETLDKILKVFVDDQCVGCDIACSFSATVRNSSLAANAHTQRLVMALNSFHGHAHGRQCQLRWQPMYLCGLRLEDLESCERLFSASNAVARLIRHRSYFYYLQFIDLHFQQWDDDKYLELTNFMLNNYQQALGILRDYTPEVKAFKDALPTSILFHGRLPKDTMKVEYVEALKKLNNMNKQWGGMTTVAWFAYTPAGLAPSGSLSVKEESHLRAEEAERRSILHKLDLAMNVVQDLERRLGLDERWTCQHPEYQEAAAYINNQEFIHAVEQLEGLIVACLFELAKANIMGTYKYNFLTPKQDPPRPQLEYRDIAGYGMLVDFELLKHSRHDIMEKPWSIAANHLFTSKYFKIIRANEEIQRLNVEIHRMRTWVDDEDRHLLHAYEELKKTDPELSTHVKSLYNTRHPVNDVHRARIRAIYRLPGFTGPDMPGTRLGKMEVTENHAEVSSSGQVATAAEEDLDVEISDDDIANDEVLRLGEFLETLFTVLSGGHHHHFLVELLDRAITFSNNLKGQDMHSATVEGVPTAPTGSQEDRPETPHPSMTWASTAPGLVQGEPDRNPQRVHASFIQDPYEHEDVYRDIMMHLCNSLTALERYTDCVAVTFTAWANFTGGTPINPSDIDISIHMPHITLRSKSLTRALKEAYEEYAQHAKDIASEYRRMDKSTASVGRTYAMHTMRSQSLEHINLTELQVNYQKLSSAERKALVQEITNLRDGRSKITQTNPKAMQKDINATFA